MLQVKIFEAGALYSGGIVGGIGILILSSRWYKKSTYMGANILAILVFFGGGFLSLLFGISGLSSVLLVFAVLWGTEKVIEIPIESIVGFGFRMLVAGGLLTYAWNWCHDNPDAILNIQRMIQQAS